MTCDHFGRDQICPQVNASFLPFGHPTQVNASSVTARSLEIAFLLRLSCTCEETCQSVWPSNASLFASSTCRYLLVLASPFDQRFMVIYSLMLLSMNSLFLVSIKMYARTLCYLQLIDRFGGSWWMSPRTSTRTTASSYSLDVLLTWTTCTLKYIHFYLSTYLMLMF